MDTPPVHYHIYPPASCATWDMTLEMSHDTVHQHHMLGVYYVFMYLLCHHTLEYVYP